MKTKLLIALSTAGVATAGLGASVLPSAAATFALPGGVVATCPDSVTVAPPSASVAEQLGCEVTAPAAPAAPEIPATPSSPGTSGSGQPTPPATSGGPAPAAPAPAAPGADDEGPAPAGANEEGDEPRSGRGGRRQTTTGRKARRRRAAAGGGAATSGAPSGGETVEERDERERREPRSRYRGSGGAPTSANPTLSVADIGAAPVGVPNFFIDKFRIPPFLLSIYQAAGIEYGIRWEVLAAINEIETDYGRNLNVSTAGAVGWMQFLPSTWKAYGVDANGDRRKDPYNPVDAIFGAARYLRAAGGDEDLRKAVFAYNHADWYVDSVLMRARLIGGLPANLVGSLTGLTQGLFPVHAKARYADDLSERQSARRVAKGRNAAVPVESNTSRRGINVYAKSGSPVIAVQDGRIVKLGRSKRLGRYIQLRDAYGNTYTYADLGSIAQRHPVAKRGRTSREEVARELKLPKGDPRPDAPASAGRQRAASAPASRPAARRAAASEPRPALVKERLFASPRRPASFAAGGREQVAVSGDGSAPGVSTFRPYFVGDFGLDADQVELRRLKVGSKVIAGTILGRIGRTSRTVAPHALFEIRPAGRGAPRIDPKPVLDGWKLLESTAVYRAEGRNPFFGPDAKRPSLGQILLMSKDQLQRRVLENPRVDIYACGRRDIRAGKIDRRILATLEFLSASGLKPTVTSLQCGHGFLTASGNVSHHSSGNAVDIAKVNGVPILGHQGRGSVTDIANRRLLTLQGTMKPAQIISLMKYKNATNTFAMGDHADHIHVGFQPLYGTNSKLGRQVNAVLKPGQWIKLIDRLGQIDNPTVRVKPSRYAIGVKPGRASESHSGE